MAEHESREAKLGLIREIISMYHTTRLRETDAAEHVLSKPTVQKAFAAFSTTEQAPSDGLREAEIARLMHVIDRDRYAVAVVLNNITGTMRGYTWLSEPGRGPYEYDDDRYQQEFGDALQAIEAALKPLSRLAWDKTDCTTEPDKVAAANVAGRERAAALAASPSTPVSEEMREAVAPIPMLLFCPLCGAQHIDEPDERTPDWDNPPHRSHLCHACNCVWRPADVATVGVVRISSQGKADTWGESNCASPALIPSRVEVLEEGSKT